MIGQVSQKSASSTATTNSTARTDVVVDHRRASDVTAKSTGGVHAHGTNYTTAAQPSAYARGTAKAHARTAEGPNPRLAGKVRNGQVKAEHLDVLDARSAAKTLEQMAGGGKKQLENLRQLMMDPTFANTLGTALEEMKPEARQQFLRIAGENAKSPDGSKISRTMERALNGASESTRVETLRDAFLGTNAGAIASANQYISADGKRATDLMDKVARQFSGASGEKLAKVLGEFDQPAMNTLINGMSNLHPSEAQMQFRVLGDAVFGKGKFYALRDMVGRALEASPVNGGFVLGHVARDLMGAESSGQKLAKDILANMDPKQLEEFKANIRMVTGAGDVKKLMPKP